MTQQNQPPSSLLPSPEERAQIELGILGWPVAHSKSPAMHEAAAHALNLDLRYRLYPCAPQALVETVNTIVKNDIRGFNITVPHKQAIMPLLTEIDADAQAIGAVNTVVCEGNTLRGYNTDALGLVRSLQEQNVKLTDAHVVVLGAGGAARAAVVGLAQHGAASVTIAARRSAQANALIATLSNHLHTPLHQASFDDLATRFANTQLVIQATSATLEGNTNAIAFADALPLHALPKNACVVDLVYKPLQTTVLQRAEQLTLHTVDGLGMLLHQGALAFEYWTGQTPPLEIMRNAILPK